MRLLAMKLAEVPGHLDAFIKEQKNDRRSAYENYPGFICRLRIRNDNTVHSDLSPGRTIAACPHEISHLEPNIGQLQEYHM